MSNESGKKWMRVVAKAWADEVYKLRLKEDTAAVLAEEGIETPANVKLRVIEDTPGMRTLILPPRRKRAAAPKISKSAGGHDVSALRILTSK